MEITIVLWMLVVALILATHPDFKVMFRKGYRQSYICYALTTIMSVVVVIISPLLFIYGAFRETIRGAAT